MKGLGLLAVALLAVFALACSYRDPEDVERWFNDRLPEQASRADVEQFLTQEEIPHSYIEARYESRLFDKGIPPETHVVTALVRGARGHFLDADQDFRVYFVLSDDDRVTRIVVEEVFTSL